MPGPNLITNGDFESPAGAKDWSVPDGWTVSSPGTVVGVRKVIPAWGQLLYVSPSYSASTTFSAPPGRYLLSFKVAYATFASSAGSYAVEIDDETVASGPVSALTAVAVSYQYNYGAIGPVPITLSTGGSHAFTAKNPSTVDTRIQFDDFVLVSADSPGRLLCFEPGATGLLG